MRPRMPLRTSRCPRWQSFTFVASVVSVGVVLALGPLAGRAVATVEEQRFVVRGTYFREASTRVVQPMMEGSVNLPEGFDLAVHGLVDAISSASIAQGANTDKVFTENRYEAGLRVGKSLGPSRLGSDTRFASQFRYSHEPDYQSYAAGLDVNHWVLEKTGLLFAGFAVIHDEIKPRPPLDPRTLDVLYFKLSYGQALTPTTLLQGGYEAYVQKGFLGNPYISHPDLGREKLPDRRIRHALSIKIAQYVPRAALGFQLLYRYYFDQGSFFKVQPWGMQAHTIEPRVFKTITQHFEVRLSYRYHWQGNSDFWCNARPDNGGSPGCYPMDAPYHSWDPKFGHLSTHLPELKLIWDMHVLSALGFPDWMTAGSFDVGYGYYFQSTPYGQPYTDKTAPPVIGWGFTRDHGGAHLLQTGYSLPF
jgi:hypothetical protein